MNELNKKQTNHSERAALAAERINELLKEEDVTVEVQRPAPDPHVKPTFLDAFITLQWFVLGVGILVWLEISIFLKRKK